MLLRVAPSQNGWLFQAQTFRAETWTAGFHRRLGTISVPTRSWHLGASDVERLTPVYRWPSLHRCRCCFTCLWIQSLAPISWPSQLWQRWCICP